MKRVAVIAGDGIGKEVIPAGIQVVKKAAAVLASWTIAAFDPA